jgi:transaldolase
MSNQYFHRVNQQTDNRMWVNNPTVAESHLAIEAGAVACTTNPTFCGRILKEEPVAAQEVLRAVLAREPDDTKAAHKIQQELIARITPVFMPIYEKTQAALGYVSVQGDPHLDHHADHIIAECRADRARLGPNHIAKIPVTTAGLKAIDVLLRENVPVIATEVFSMDQARVTCDLYDRAVRESGHRPAFFLTHITGIYDEYLAGYVKAHNIAIDPAVLQQAGCIVARRQYQMMCDRGFGGVLLGGGVRAPYHFTELLGSTMHVTMNYSTIVELEQLNPPIEHRMGAATDPKVVAELRAKLPDFQKAYDDNALRLDDFAGFGPVVHFATVFRRGWDALLAAIAAARKAT